MEIGISTASLFSRAQNENAVRIIGGLGCCVTEIFFNTYSEYRPAFIKLLKERLGHLCVHSVHALGTQFEPELFNENARVRGDADKILRKVLAAARGLGAKYYTFHGQYRMKHTPYVLDYSRLADKINRINSIAVEYGITLSYENVHYAFSAMPEFFAKLLPLCPGIAATLDIKQSFQAGVNPAEFINVMGGRISTIHVCDTLADGLPTMPGKGVFDFKTFFSALKTRNINAPVLIEVYQDNYKDYSELKECLDSLRLML